MIIRLDKTLSACDEAQRNRFSGPGGLIKSAPLSQANSQASHIATKVVVLYNDPQITILLAKDRLTARKSVARSCVVLQ